MAAVDELTTWLRAQLDDDERVARAADSGRWLPEDKGITFEYRSDVFPDGEAQARLVADTRANQWHIANWDPARVLAEVEAKRQVLDLHHPDSQLENWYWSQRKCAECGGLWHQWLPDRLPTDIGPEAGCRTVRILAQPYAGRPGFREGWRAAPGS